MSNKNTYFFLTPKGAQEKGPTPPHKYALQTNREFILKYIVRDSHKNSYEKCVVFAVATLL